MKESIIEELLYKTEGIMENCRPKKKEYDDNSIRIGKVRKEILDNMTEKQKELFEIYEKLNYRVLSDEIDEAFKQGASLGVRFTAEAFLIGKETE